MVHYAAYDLSGLDQVNALGDGISVNLTWFRAYPDLFSNGIVYHIYYSTAPNTVFSDGIKYVIIDGSLTANIIGLTPGQEYWFGIRPVEYDPKVITFLSSLPISHDNVRYYPSSVLRQDISATDVVIPLMDVDAFPSSGIIQAGVELIRYLAIDTVNKNLLVPSSTSPTAASIDSVTPKTFDPTNVTRTNPGGLADLQLVGVPVGHTMDGYWNVLCVGGRPSALDGYFEPTTVEFEAIGSISESVRDGYGNPIIWRDDGYVVSNGIISFQVVNTNMTPDGYFHVGDSFLIRVGAGSPGALGGRGFNNTPITMHTISGFDGYNTYSPLISVVAIEEDAGWDQTYVCRSRFEYPNFPGTIIDGYRQVAKDILSTDLSAADAANVGFPMYDYAGYHRTDPVQLLNGTCVGTYIGGEMGCIDKYGNYNIYRGFSLQDQNTQRQEIKLSIDGQNACLIRRVNTGITCSCYLASSEYPDDRCPFCLGGKIVLSYDQYFNPRQSDGRIKVRVSPTAENLRMREAGLESEFPLDMWTLTVPTIKTRDVIVLFDQDDNEEFRYEVGDVIRNKTILGLQGGQTLKTFRIRKTDPAYQIRIFRNTADFPSKLNTSLGFTTGLPPHAHKITLSEKVLAVSRINQTTAISQGHSHQIVSGVVMPTLSHTHTIIMS